jgi:hypothetical protein
MLRADVTAPIFSAEPDYFGYDVELQGARLAAGAPATYNGWGVGHIFEKTGPLAWTHRATLTPSPPVAGTSYFQYDYYGCQVALSADTVVLGTINGEIDAAMFRRQSNGSWIQAALLRRFQPGWTAWPHGHAAAILPDRIAVGNSLLPGYTQAGAISLYPTVGPTPDGDGDGVADLCDNCPVLANASQANCDGDEFGDACEILMPNGDCNGDLIPDDCQAGFSDCDADGVRDICEIAGGTEGDLNQDGIPDRCQCIADVNGSGTVDAVDLAIILTRWGGNAQTYPDADIDRDGVIGSSDLSIVLAGWGPCPN